MKLEVGDRVFLRATGTVEVVAEVLVSVGPSGAETNLRLRGRGEALFSPVDVEAFPKRLPQADVQADKLSLSDRKKPS